MSTLWGLLAEPSIVAAIISLFAGSGAGAAATYASHRLRRDAVALEDINNRAAGRAWRAIVLELRDQVDDLREQIDDRDRRVDVLDRRLTECEADRADLRRRLG